jgi:hypothetical protein
MTPYVGQIVHVFTCNPSYQFNGVGIGPYPAIVTRAWSEKCINVTVFPDCALPYVLTSVVRQEDHGQYNWWAPLPTGL